MTEDKAMSEGGRRALYLRPWHAFVYDGHEYVLNTGRLLTRRVRPGFIATLERLAADPLAPRTDDDELELFQLELASAEPVPVGMDEAPPPRTPPPITSINLMVAQRCNLRCIYCYGGGGEYGDAGMMSEATARRTVDWLIGQAGERTRLSISFFGGEPLLALPLVKSTVVYAREAAAAAGKSFGFAVCTNAMLLDDATIAYIKDNDIRALVGFDGPPEIHDRNRPRADGGPSSPVFLEHARRLTEEMPDAANFRATIWRSEDLPAVVDYLGRFCGGSYQTAFAAACLHDGEPGQGEGLPSPADGIGFARESIAAFVDAVRRGDEAEVSRYARWLDFGAALALLGPRRPQRAHCGVGSSMAGVGADGTLYACHRFVGSPEHVIGDVFAGTGDRDRFVNKPTFRTEPCASCWARPYCVGGCLHYNLGATGDMFTPSDDWCRLVKAWIEGGIHLDHELTEGDKELLYEHKLVARRPCPYDL